MDDDFGRDPRRPAIAIMCGLALVILVVIVGAVAWFALDALEWLAGVMRGNG